MQCESEAGLWNTGTHFGLSGILDNTSAATHCVCDMQAQAARAEAVRQAGAGGAREAESAGQEAPDRLDLKAAQAAREVGECMGKRLARAAYEQWMVTVYDSGCARTSTCCGSAQVWMRPCGELNSSCSGYADLAVCLKSMQLAGCWSVWLL